MMINQFPVPDDQLVTLANWRKPPFNKWAFNHVCELVPSAIVSANPDAQRLEVLDKALPDFRVSHGGLEPDLDAWLSKTHTDSLVILKGGKILYEYYAPGQSPTVPHIWMSVSKSVLGLLAGIVENNFGLDLAAPIVRVIPEVAGTAYDGATIRDALDMRVGIKFDEDYHAKDGAIIQYRKAHLWDPVPQGEPQTDLRSFFSTLHERDGLHNDRFHYVSPNTDLLGWILERVTGIRYADLLSDLIWKPLQAERDAYITVDRLGAPRCAGGFCATPRDMARLGRLLVTGGRVNDTQVVPQDWIKDIMNFDSRQAWTAGDFDDLFEQADMHYRSQWYVKRGERPMAYGVGVFGQHVFVDPAADLVIAKCSSLPMPLEQKDLSLTLAGIECLRQVC